MRKRLVLIIVLCFVLTSLFPTTTVLAVTQATYYVSPAGNDTTGDGSISNPWQTIQKARDVVRTINSNMTGDIYVYLRGGTYTLDDSIVLGSSDSGTNGYNIIYKAYNGETPVISGGQSLSGGWTLYDGAKNIYKKTSVNWSFRQMYAGGKWGTRARQPNLVDEQNGGDYYSMSDTTYPFDISSSYIGSWANNGVSEFVWIGHWSQQRGRINNYTVNGSTATVYFKSPENNFAVNHHNQNPGYFYFENAYELLDSEGEWYLDTTTSTLYYKPRSGENMSTLEVIVPKVESLIKIEGTSPAPVHNVQFYGITFKHNNWTTPNSYGYVDIQAGHLLETGSTGSDLYQGTFSPVSGMANIKYANNIRFERNVFTLGGSWGIMEQAGSDHNTYIGNVFSYLASGAITVGNALDPAVWGGLPAGTAAYDVIKDNLVEWVGYYYKDAVAILACKSKYVTIEYNEVRNVPYTGISIGFEWDDTGNQDSHDNNVRYNRIHNAMLLLDDGGGIYTLGKMTNSSFDHNFLYNIMKSPYNGGYPNGYTNAAMYLDNGSSYKSVQYNAGDQAGMFTYAANAPNHDNTGSYNYYNTSFVGYTNGYSSWTSNTSNYGTVWAPGAKDIMNGAGIESSYRDIGPATLGASLATDGMASASSIYEAATAAAKANDNNCESGLWASDATEANPWWQVDLGEDCRLYEIDVIARMDLDQPASRKNFAIRASNDISFSSYTEFASVGDTVAFPHRGVYSATINNNNTFRYIRIQRINNAGHFNFAECKVFGIPVNIALSVNGGTAAASSSHSSGNYPVTKLNDNGTSGYWNDGTQSSYPDWCEVNWAGATKSVKVVMLRLPVLPTLTLAQRTLGSLTLQYKDSNDVYQNIQTITNWVAPVTDDGTQIKTFTLPPVSAKAIRVKFDNGNSDGWTFMEEMRIFEGLPANLALPANSGTAAASSYLTGYPVAKVNDDGTSGYWNDNTQSSYPDWCEVNWAGAAKSVGQVTLRLPVLPALTPAQRTLGSLTLQYKDSSDVYQNIQTITNWLAPTINNGTQIKTFLFTPVSAKAIRVKFDSGNSDGWSFMEEIQVY